MYGFSSLLFLTYVFSCKSIFPETGHVLRRHITTSSTSMAVRLVGGQGRLKFALGVPLSIQKLLYGPLTRHSTLITQSFITIVTIKLRNFSTPP